MSIIDAKKELFNRVQEALNREGFARKVLNIESTPDIGCHDNAIDCTVIYQPQLLDLCNKQNQELYTDFLVVALETEDGALVEALNSAVMLSITANVLSEQLLVALERRLECRIANIIVSTKGWSEHLAHVASLDFIKLADRFDIVNGRVASIPNRNIPIMSDTFRHPAAKVLDGSVMYVLGEDVGTMYRVTELETPDDPFLQPIKSAIVINPNKVVKVTF